MSLEEFEAINSQLIETQKAFAERQRILSIMESIDECLVAERKRLPKLALKKKYERYDVQELEGLTPKALFYTLLKKRDEQLDKEVQEFLDAKLAVENCRLKIAGLKSQLSALEEQLVLFADIDESLKSLQKAQSAILNKLKTPEASRYRKILSILSTKIALHQEFSAAFELGNKILFNIEKIIELALEGRDSFGFKEYTRTSYLSFEQEEPIKDAISLSFKTSAELDYFQLIIKKLTDENSNLSLHTPHLSLGFNIYTFTRRTSYKKYYDPADQTKIARWLIQLENMMLELEPIVKLLEIKLDEILKETSLLETEKTNLLKIMWQAESFSAVENVADKEPVDHSNG